jgi:hypothetical protein
MEDVGETAKAEAANRCSGCGERVDTIFGGPESGVFASCRCGIRHGMQNTPSLPVYGIAVGITLIASVFLLIG